MTCLEQGTIDRRSSQLPATHSCKTWLMVIAVLLTAAFGPWVMAAASSSEQLPLAPLLIDDNREILLLNRMHYLHGESAPAYLQDVLNLPDSEWQAHRSRFGEYIPQGAPIWFRFSFRVGDGVSQRWILDLQHLFPGDTRIFLVDADGARPIAKFNAYNGFADRSVMHQESIAPLDLYPGQSGSIYIHVVRQQKVMQFLAPRLMTLPEFSEDFTHTTFLFVLEQGIILALLIYHFILTIVVRDRSYLAYSVLLAACLFYSLNTSGVGFHYFWPDMPQIMLGTRPLYGALIMVAGAFFVSEFLDVKRLSSLWQRSLQVFASVSVLAGLASLFLPAFYYFAVPALAIPFYLLCTWLGWMALRRGTPYARFFVLAWGVYTLGILVYAFGLIAFRTSLDEAYLFQRATFIVHLFLFALALADRIRDLRREKRKAETENLHKSRFLANMSHEIRTPLNGVVGMLKLLEKTSLDSKQKHYAGLAEQSAETLLAVVNDILDFSKIEAGKLELESIPFDLCESLQPMFETMRLRAEEKGLELQLDLSAVQAEHRGVRGDPNRIRQIFNNLIGNAIKFTDSGYVRVTLATRSDSGDGNLVLRANVVDTGIGITEQHKNKLFEAFSQADASTTREFGGTGLGLSICRQLCELMQGSISVSGHSDGGSDFEFELRLMQSSEVDAVSNDDVLNRYSAANGDSVKTVVRVLAVDDNRVNLEVAKGMLEDLGIEEISCVESAYDAIDLLQGSSRDSAFDLVLMDCQMPGMDGYQATRLIRSGSAGKYYIDMPIVALTANAMKGDREKCLAAGMNDYLPKPLMPEALETAISLWCPHFQTPADAPIQDTENDVAKELPVPEHKPVTDVQASFTPAPEVQSETISGDSLSGDIDRAKLLQLVRGKQRLAIQILSMAEEDLQEDLQDLHSSFTSGDREQTGKTAHKIKGTALNIACPGLAQVAKQLEQSAKRDNSIPLDELHRAVQDLGRDCVEKIPALHAALQQE